MKHLLLVSAYLCIALFNLFPQDNKEIQKEKGLSANSSKAKKSLSTTPASIFIISGEEIKKYGWQNIEDILSNVPGMYLINDYFWFGTDNFGLRGFFSSGSFSTVNIMINGVSQMEDWYNSFPLSKINVPVEAIDRIEVIRGPGNPGQGNNAFLGTINIITNKSSNGVKAAASYGTNNNYRAFAGFAKRSKNFSFNASAAMYGSDGIDAPYAEMMSAPFNPATGIPSWNLPNDATSKGQLKDHRKYFGASLKYRGLFFETSHNFSGRGVIDYYPGIGNGHLAEVQSSSSVIGFNKYFGRNTNLILKGGYHSFRNRLDYRHLADSTSYSFNDIYSDALTGEVNFIFKPAVRLQSSVGVYYRSVFRDKLVVDAPLFSNYINLDAGLGRDKAKSNWAGYVQSMYSFNQKLHLNGIVRFQQTPQYDINYQLRYDPNGNYNYYSIKGTYLYDKIEILPQAALIYNASPVHNFKLLFGMAVKEPSIGENMDIVRYPTRPQLEPARIQTLEINYLGLFDKIIKLNASIFYNSVNNLISRTNTLHNGVMQLFNTNSGKLRTVGTELTIYFNPIDRISSRVSFVYQNSKNLQPGYENINLEYAPNILGYAAVAYRFYKEHTIAFSGNYIDKMETYWAPSSASLDPAAGSRIGETSPAYLVGNLNLRLNNLFDRGIFVYAYASNLFDTKVIYPTTRSNDIFDKGTIGYGRNFIFGAGVNL